MLRGGPMQIAWSAKRTRSLSRSPSECTATVLTPSPAHPQITRTPSSARSAGDGLTGGARRGGGGRWPQLGGARRHGSSGCGGGGWLVGGGRGLAEPQLQPRLFQLDLADLLLRQDLEKLLQLVEVQCGS